MSTSITSTNPIIGSFTPQQSDQVANTTNTQGTGAGLGGVDGKLPDAGQFLRQFGLDAFFQPPAQPANTDAATTRAEGALDNLSQAEIEDLAKKILSAFRDPDALGRLMVEFAAMSRQNALDERLSARASARAELEGQAGEMRSAAAKMMAAAIVSFVIAVVMAVVSVVSAVKAVKSAAAAESQVKQSIGDQAKADKFAAAGDTQKASQLSHSADAAKSQADLINRKAEAMNQLMNAVTGFLGGISKGIEGSLNAQAKIDEAKGVERSAAAQDAQAEADMAKKFMEELEELIRATIQFLKQMQDAEADMMATASRL